MPLHRSSGGHSGFPARTATRRTRPGSSSVRMCSRAAPRRRQPLARARSPRRGWLIPAAWRAGGLVVTDLRFLARPTPAPARCRRLCAGPLSVQCSAPQPCHAVLAKTRIAGMAGGRQHELLPAPATCRLAGGRGIAGSRPEIRWPGARISRPMCGQRAALADASRRRMHRPPDDDRLPGRPSAHDRDRGGRFGDSPSVRDRERARAGTSRGECRSAARPRPAALPAAPNGVICTRCGDSSRPRRDTKFGVQYARGAA